MLRYWKGQRWQMLAPATFRGIREGSQSEWGNGQHHVVTAATLVCLEYSHKWPFYQKASCHADMGNMGSHGGEGGCCNAAAFLSCFVKPETRWAHLDLAPEAVGRDVGGSIWTLLHQNRGKYKNGKNFPSKCRIKLSNCIANDHFLPPLLSRSVIVPKAAMGTVWDFFTTWPLRSSCRAFVMQLFQHTTYLRKHFQFEHISKTAFSILRTKKKVYKNEKKKKKKKLNGKEEVEQALEVRHNLIGAYVVKEATQKKRKWKSESNSPTHPFLTVRRSGQQSRWEFHQWWS